MSLSSSDQQRANNIVARGEALLPAVQSLGGATPGPQLQADLDKFWADVPWLSGIVTQNGQAFDTAFHSALEQSALSAEQKQSITSTVQRAGGLSALLTSRLSSAAIPGPGPSGASLYCRVLLALISGALTIGNWGLALRLLEQAQNSGCLHGGPSDR